MSGTLAPPVVFRGVPSGAARAKEKMAEISEALRLMREEVPHRLEVDEAGMTASISCALNRATLLSQLGWKSRKGVTNEEILKRIARREFETDPV